MTLDIVKKDRSFSIVGDIDNIDREDKVSIIKNVYKHSKEILPDYEKLEKELNSYDVSLSEELDIPDLSKLNKLYAITQAFLTRVGTIEAIAVNNFTNWKRLCCFMEGYIKDLESELLLSEEIKNLTCKLQEAALKVQLKRYYNKLDLLKDCLMESEAFVRTVNIRKEDLKSVLLNINRQARILKQE